jgi:putative FmdB family regulatory protein
MPTYEYRCPNGHLFEKFYPTMASKRRAACPQCGKRAEQLISGGAGLVFKGSGFYITDYKRAGEQKPSDGEAKTADSSKPDAPKKPDAGKAPEAGKAADSGKQGGGKKKGSSSSDT